MALVPSQITSMQDGHVSTDEQRRSEITRLGTWYS